MMMKNLDRRAFLKTASIGATGALVGLPALAQGKGLGAVGNLGDRAFTHPGLLHDRDELTFIKAQIQAGKEPWLAGWQRLERRSKDLLRHRPGPRKEVVRGPSNNPDIGSSEMSLDCSAAYTLAIAWCLSGERAYADKAIEILNAWSATLRTISGHDTKLLSGMMGVKFVNAAELIRHTHDGWQSKEQDRFETLCREVFYEPIKDFYPTANGNWDASMIQTMLAMGVFLNDAAMFDRAANYYRSGEGNGAITKYFNDFGQCQETGRDQAHTQMGLGFLGCACEMAWKQGVDLYGEADNRLALGFEYTAKYNLGHDVRYEPYKSVEGRYHYKRISDDSRGRFSPIYRRVAYHYHFRKGMEMPYTLQAAEQVSPDRRRRRSRYRGSAHFYWTELMFVRPHTDVG